MLLVKAVNTSCYNKPLPSFSDIIQKSFISYSCHRPKQVRWLSQGFSLPVLSQGSRPILAGGFNSSRGSQVLQWVLSIWPAN